MAFSGVNIRQTSGFDTDDAGYTYSLGEVYPTTRGGLTFGWTPAITANTRDRSALYTPMQAGIGFQNNAGGTTVDFKLDLPSGAGTYRIRLCAGDFTAAQNVRLVIKDGSTVLATLNQALSSAEFLDAAGTVHVAANYGSNNAFITHTFAGTQLVVTVGGHSSATLASVLSSVSVEFVGASDTTPPTITGPSGATGATSSISIAENTTAVHTFTANEAVTWSLNGGADVARFTINASTGALAFVSAPDFESPTDADSNNQYIVGVRATDAASNATTQTCTVTVTDVVESGPAGTITSSPLKDNTGTLHLSAPFEAFVLNAVTGALVVRKTGLTSNATTGVVSFSDAALSATTSYRIVWRQTTTGAQGVETLTAT